VLARFNCAILFHTSPGERNFVTVFTINSEVRVHLCHYISA